MPWSVPRWQSVGTLAIAILSVVSALLGLFNPGHYRPELLPGFYVQDALILLVGVPALLVGLVYARRGSLRGRIVWLGTLAYMTYMWASIALQIAFNQFFLGYVILFGLSVYTLVGALASTDPDAVQAAVAPRISARIYAAFLWVIAVGLAFLWLSELVPATVSGDPPLLVAEMGPQALASHFIDLSTVVPAMAIAGTWLWRERPWGYVVGGAGLVFGAVLAPTLTGMTLVLLFEGSVTVPLVAAVFTALPALIAAVLAIRFVISIPAAGRSSSRAVGGGRPA